MRKTLILVIIALFVGIVIGYLYSNYNYKEQSTKISAANVELKNCLNQVDRNDPLGLFDKNSTQEAKRKVCFTKYPPKNNLDPLGIGL